MLTCSYIHEQFEVNSQMYISKESACPPSTLQYALS